VAKRKYIRYVTDDKLKKVSESNKNHIKKYFNFKNMNLSDTSKKSYQSDFNQWLVFINEKYEQGAISHEDIVKILQEEDGIEEMVDLLEDFIAFCVSVLGNNERRIQRRMSSISSFFLFLRKKRKIRENPLDFMERPRLSPNEKPQIVQTFLSKEQIKNIRKGLKKMDDLQLEVYFELALSSMARVNALSNIKVAQINFKEEVIERVIEKEGYEVTLFVSTKAMDLIKKWLDYRKKEGIEQEYLFITKYGGEWKNVSKTTIQTNWIKKIGGIIDVDLHSHDIRHSASSILFNDGCPLEVVQRLLNHKSPTVTQQYYIREDMAKMRETKKNFEI
jgi:integrase/recombinase XerC